MMVHETSRPPDNLLDGSSLFLDFDGTLVPLAERPDRVVVSDCLRALLQQLSAELAGRLAIISGRSVAEIDAMLGALPVAVCGSHGLERRLVDGGMWQADRPAGLDHVLGEMRMFQSSHPILFLEQKPLGVALHYRQAPSLETDCVALASRLAATPGLKLQAGKMMVEVRAAGHDKGSALAALMALPPYAGTRPVFIGDDLTDEPAFQAAQDLGGHGIVVAADRPSAAHYRLDGVGETLEWLTRAGAALS